MGTKDALHALVDELSDEDADQLLDLALSDLGPVEPLSEADLGSIRRGLDDARAGRILSTDQLLERLSGRTPAR